MAQSNPGFTIEEIPEQPDNVIPLKHSFADKAMVTGVMLGLKALSQGAAVALGHIAAHIFSLLTVGSAFWLWAATPTPNTYQLVGLGGYALFILAANVIVRRK